MAECNVTSLSYTLKTEDKICKYSYASWCPTCDRDSPRRRTKSETTYEPCRRKGKEMKTFTPKKYDRHQEYENMELDYNLKDLRLDRIRANLCELPTSYISNNCQLHTNMSKLSTNQDIFEFNKFQKDYENSYPVDDYKSLMGSFDAMDKIGRCKYDEKSVKPDAKQFYKMCEGRTNPKNASTGVGYNQNTSNSSHPSNGVISKNFTPRSILTKYDRMLDMQDRNFDTCTFFDKQFNPTEVRERYCKELDILREKLKDLRNHKYCPVKPPSLIKNLDKYKDWQITNADDIKIIENVTSPLIDGQERFHERRMSANRLRREQKRITVKTKQLRVSSKTKLRPKSVKIINRTDFDSELSDLETSDKDEDIEGELSSSDDSKGDKTDDIPVSVGEAHTPATVQKGSGDATPSWPLRESLFPNIPPYINFTMHDSDPNCLPTGRRYLKWKLSTITPIVVRKTLINTGFRLVRKSNEWIGTWGKHMKSPVFKTLKNSQRLNHFAGTFQLGRKDRLWKNLQRLMHRYGTKEFGIIPQTYVLPHDLKLLKQNWECKDGSAGEKWIVKPPASARGVGIKVINKWSQLPKQTALVVQKYIADPYLINGSKFDLRLYVLVTSFNPLRIYIYPEGLVRFASVKYTDNDKDLKDRYMHLTNYSINKMSSQYTANEDANSCQGHKWTLSKLWEFMGSKGIDTQLLWRNLKSLVIKTMISGESPITQLCNENVNSRYNCYELFGVDVLLDQRLKPWLLEVNISPSLHSTSPLDLHVKGPLVQTLFNIAQFHLPGKLYRSDRDMPRCFDHKLYTMNLTAKETHKHNYYVQLEKRDDYLADILQNLTGDDVRFLTQAEDELVARGKFERIFPTQLTYRFLEFMPPRYYNRLFDAWEMKYGTNREEGIKRLQDLCAKKVHLKVAAETVASKNCASTIRGTTNLQPSTQGHTQFEQCGIKTDTMSAQI